MRQMGLLFVRADPISSGMNPLVQAHNSSMPLQNFHPAVAAWFEETFPAPTPAQARAWPAIASGRHTLIAAPTGSGKTLAAFLAAIDELVRRGVEGSLGDETAVVYVSPLKALSNDVRINLQAPLEGIRAQLEKQGYPDVDIRTFVRTGDTPQAERDAMRKRPPHIVVTTPESLYILLGSESGRAMLATTRSVIVDEIHALAPSKRGAHLSLSLERLEALCGRRLTRIGLSATQKPISEVAKFLVGSSLATSTRAPSENTQSTTCDIIDVGYARKRDLALEVPPVPLSAVMSGDVWQLVHQRLTELIQAHRTTLIFVNTRRMAERVARHLSEILGKDAVTSHHGSLAREQRLAAEQKLKRGELRALVATASLELGIDIGDVDLVCQIASPRSISTFLQRVGRANHSVEGEPKGRLFPLSRDDLVECSALLDAVRRGELDTLHVERGTLDVLAQQIVAEVACREWNEQELYELVRRADPFADLTVEKFREICRMLAEGYTTRRGPRSAYLHRDAVNGMLRARRGARLTAITSGGAIPDTADYEVVLEPQAQMIGTVHEDFAVESMAGDIFQLGNVAYRVLRVERGRLRVEDAKGAPPTIPFWLGEAPGRSDELSFAVSRLREEISARLPGGNGGERARHVVVPSGAAAAELEPRSRDSSLIELGTEDEGMRAPSSALDWLIHEVGLDESAARQLVEYLGATQAALGLLPTQTRLAMERFFDESGGTQLIIHSPFGSRMNRAWGLALRKRFCRTFNFELQAAATEDAIILSLSTSHSFPLDEVSRYLHSNTAEHVLVQALLDAPMFGLRWRWNAVTALALPRFVGGSKVPPQLQRMKSEDLLATVFPDQVACLENIVGERQIPDHPLVAQTLHDCLHAAMDVDALLALLKRLESGEIHIVARDLTAPSPLAAEILSARPYAFLDDAPLEERRTQAVQSRRWGDFDSTDDFARLDPEAIEAVRAEAWPEARDADELHDALMGLGYLTDAEIQRNTLWRNLAAQLVDDRRATRANDVWMAAERLPQFALLHADMVCDPPIAAPAEFINAEWTAETALVDVLRARLTGLGPTRAAELARDLDLPRTDIDLALVALERQGFVMRGQFTSSGGTSTQGWAPESALRDSENVTQPGRAPVSADSAAADRGSKPDPADIEWCERHLLARIHRYTVNRLRREIEPVEPRDFMRFLFDWQRVAPGAQVSGPDALATRARAARRLRGACRRVGGRDPARARRRLRDFLARRPLPCRSHRVDATAHCRSAQRRPGPGTPAHDLGAGARDADRAAATAQHDDVEHVRHERADGSACAVVARAGDGRLSARARRIVLRRTARGHTSVADRTRGRACRTRCRGHDQFGQLRRIARTARAAVAQALAASPPRSAHGVARHRRCRTLGAAATATGAGCRYAEEPARKGAQGAECGCRSARTDRAHAAQALRRDLLAPDRARGAVAAAMARTAARLPPSRGARRDPRRPFHRGSDRRTIRAARSDRAAARGPAEGRRRHARRRLRRGSAQPARSDHRGREAADVDECARALSRRRADRDARRQRIQCAGRDGRGRGMGHAQAPPAARRRYRSARAA